jgi:hypothetical protein
VTRISARSSDLRKRSVQHIVIPFGRPGRTISSLRSCVRTDISILYEDEILSKMKQYLTYMIAREMSGIFKRRHASSSKTWAVNDEFADAMFDVLE